MEVPFPAQSTPSSLLHHIHLYHVLILGVAVYLIQALYCIFVHPLRRIPGPFFAQFSEGWRARRYFRSTWHDDILFAHERYGPVVRIAPNEVSFVDKDALTAVYGHTTGTKKTSWYDTWKAPVMDISFFNSTNVKEHSFLRKRVSATYSMSSILAFEPLMETVADSLWSKFRPFAAKGTPIDLDHWASYFAFDIFGSISLGGPLGFVERGEDVNNIIGSIHSGFYLMSNMGYLPGQMWIFNNAASRWAIKNLAPPSANSFTKFLEWMAAQIESRMRESPSKERRRDMVDHFIAMKDPNGDPVKMPAILVEGGNIIGAGADTTSVAIRAVLGQLLLHLDDYRRVQAEVDKAYIQLNLSNAPGQGMKYQVLEKLPFLNACIKEATRLHPSILYQLPRETPAGGITIRGHYLAPGTTCSISPISQNRCKEVFGDNANDWRPERWVANGDGTAEQIKTMDKYLVTFGYGSRTCVGRHLALVELYKFIGQFIHQFDCELVNKDQPRVTKSFWFANQTDMWVRLKNREVACP